MARKQKRAQVAVVHPEMRSGEQQNIAVSILETIPELHEQIRELAYQLYEQRGRQEGRAEQDWIEAEAIILGRKEKLAA